MLNESIQTPLPEVALLVLLFVVSENEIVVLLEVVESTAPTYPVLVMFVVKRPAEYA